MANKKRHAGFDRGLQQVYETRSAADYKRCFASVKEVCMGTETRGVSRSTFYNKRKGYSALTVAEFMKLAAIFERYGVTEWRDDAVKK